MTLKQIIKKELLLEGIAELAGQKGLDIFKLTSFLEETKARLKSNKKVLDDFYLQYPDLNTFIKIAFGMYNKVLQNGYQINNSQNNFEKTIKPLLIKFYNSL